MYVCMYVCMCVHIYIYIYLFIYLFIEGSLEVKLPTVWTNEKQRWEESGKRREEERRSKKRKSQKKEDPGARKGRQVAKLCVFSDGSRGSKSRLAKAAGAEPAGQIRDEKLHAVVAQSTCASQNVQFRARFEVEMSKKWTPLWREAHFEVKMHNVEHFLKLRCRKSARRGA